MTKRRSVVPLNSIDEALDRYNELMPSVTDVRGETVSFDLGSYAHLLKFEERLKRIDWIKETLQDPEEIRQNFDKKYPFREIYINTVYEYTNAPGIPFLVIVDRRIVLNFWTAFIPDARYLAKVKKGKLLWEV